MSMNYVFIESGKYDNYKNDVTVNQQQQDEEEGPPSYVAVLAEKYHQQHHFTEWDIKLIEMNHMLRSMKISIYETQIMLQSYHYCYQKLEFKSQYLLDKLQQDITSLSESDTTRNISQSELPSTMNDSLTRMSQSLDNLIVEATMSLNTHMSLVPSLRKAQSYPRFRKATSESLLKRKSSPSMSLIQVEENRQLRLRQQKRRYLHSQWKLSMAMRQFAQTVQEATTRMKQEEESSISRQSSSMTSFQVIHHHHVHYHYHHHHIHHHLGNKSITEVDEAVEPDPKHVYSPIEHLASQQISSHIKKTTLTSSSSFTSLFKYALNTVIEGVLRPHAPPLQPRKIITHRIKMRTMLFATIIILQKFNKRNLWIKRGNLLLNRWKSGRQYQLWIRKSQFLVFVLHFISLGKKNS